MRGSPWEITLSPGLSSPSAAREPAVSMRWQDSGDPSHPSRRTASRSRMPGSSPKIRFRTPWEVWLAAYSKAASCSTSLITRRPSAGSMNRSVAGKALSSPTTSRTTSTMNAGTSERCGPRSFQPTSPTRMPDPNPSPTRTSRRGRDRSRGWLGSEKSWCSSTRMGSGAASAIPTHSFPTRIRGSPSGATTSNASSKRGSKPLR